MKVQRKNVFETNSSTTHSLVVADNIMGVGLDFDDSKEIILTLIPMCDIMYKDREKQLLSKLNHNSYMCSYIYTMLMWKKHIVEDTDGYWSKDKDIIELANKVNSYIDIMQKYLVELGYTITYQQPLVLDKETLDEFYIEYNDGSDVDSDEDFEEILESKESFKEYLGKIWVIQYRG